MNLNKYITITEGNIHLVLFRIQCFIQRMEVIGMQSFYNDTKAEVQLLGKDNHTVLQSMISYLSVHDSVIELETQMGDKPFIRINYQQDNSGMLIEVGSRIRITPEHIYLHQTRFAFRKGRKYPKEVWKRGNPEECLIQTRRNKDYSDMYWAEVENSFDDEMEQMYGKDPLETIEG